jgi:hypothetical protein
MFLSMIGKMLNIQYVLIFRLVYDKYLWPFCTKMSKWKLNFANWNSCRKWKIVFLYTGMSYSMLLLLNAFKIQYVNILQWCKFPMKRKYFPVLFPQNHYLKAMFDLIFLSYFNPDLYFFPYFKNMGTLAYFYLWLKKVKYSVCPKFLPKKCCVL